MAPHEANEMLCLAHGLRSGPRIRVDIGAVRHANPLARARVAVPIGIDTIVIGTTRIGIGCRPRGTDDRVINTGSLDGVPINRKLEVADIDSPQQRPGNSIAAAVAPLAGGVLAVGNAIAQQHDAVIIGIRLRRYGSTILETPTLGETVILLRINRSTRLFICKNIIG